LVRAVLTALTCISPDLPGLADRPAPACRTRSVSPCRPNTADLLTAIPEHV